jgi:hypothetical protein
MEAIEKGMRALVRDRRTSRLFPGKIINVQHGHCTIEFGPAGSRRSLRYDFWLSSHHSVEEPFFTFRTLAQVREDERRLKASVVIREAIGVRRRRGRNDTVSTWQLEQMAKIAAMTPGDVVRARQHELDSKIIACVLESR